MVLVRSPGIPAAPFPQPPSLDVYKLGDVLSCGKRNMGPVEGGSMAPVFHSQALGQFWRGSQSVCVI